MTSMSRLRGFLDKINMFIIAAALCVLFSGCAIPKATVSSEEIASEDSVESVQEVIKEDVAEEYAVDLREEDIEHYIVFDLNEPFSYCGNPVCFYKNSTDEMSFSFDFSKGIPITDDADVYLFEAASYEDESLRDKHPVASAEKHNHVDITIPYKTKHLFSRFIPAVLYRGEYVALSDGKYISNPEALADNKEPYPEIESKKGLLLDANTANTEWLTNLNVKRIVYNLPLSLIMGETLNETYPTIDFEYNGKTYQFDGYNLAGFDILFNYLTRQGFCTTVIILNDWNEEFPEMMHPLSLQKTGRSMYYAFNTEEEEGARMMEAAALFLAERYSGGEYGMVHDWVIANEVNQQKVWNYMATDDLEYYTDSFEKSFRTFYNAIRSNYSNARVYFSIDQDWNSNSGYNSRYFNGRELLDAFCEDAKRGGDYDWSLSIHPYPNPLPRTKFWIGKFDKSPDASVVTPMNLSSVTDYMQKEELLNPLGKPRNIAVTELGFSSKVGEKTQAAAFAYCYYIIEDNEYINCFLLNRQTDDTEALKSGLALGIYNNDYSSKVLADVFTDIDSPRSAKFLPEMLEITGFDSLEEALNAAR